MLLGHREGEVLEESFEGGVCGSDGDCTVAEKRFRNTQRRVGYSPVIPGSKPPDLRCEIVENVFGVATEYNLGHAGNIRNECK